MVVCASAQKMRQNAVKFLVGARYDNMPELSSEFQFNV
jgi:hypothetical protein